MRYVCLISLAVAGCGVEGGTAASIAFMSPAPGSVHMRDTLGDAGALVADVGIMVASTGDIARVEIAVADVVLGDADAAGSLQTQLSTVGPATLSATAFDDSGVALATAAVDIRVDEPQLADCHAWLDLYKLDYSIAPGSQYPTPVRPLEGEEAGGWESAFLRSRA